MHILALDTSMGACGVAVLRAEGGSRRLVVREESMARGHAEALMPMLAEAMQEAELDYAGLDLIAATLGPGSFTGVRIAIAAARGLSLVTGVPVWGTDSLSVMAKVAVPRGAAGEAGKPFAVAVDARAAMLYFGLFDAEGRKLAGPLLLGAGEAASKLPADLSLAVGSGGAALAQAAREQGKRVEALLPELEPSAASLAELAYDAGETLPALRPLYLRPPDAKPQPAVAVARC